MSYNFPFLKLLSHLGDDSNQVVLVGGWVPAVYFTYLWPDKFFLVTKDIDLGLDDKSRLNPIFEDKIGTKHFKHRHLKMGKLRPYQLIYEDFPVDFLTSPQNFERVQKEFVGPNVLVNSSVDYEDLLKDTLSVMCEGICVRVPQPARYLTHKISLYLQNDAHRQRDIATAYYCFSKPKFREVVCGYLPKLEGLKDLEIIRKQLPSRLEAGGFVVRDVQSIYFQYGRREPSEDITMRFKGLLGLMN